MLLTLWISKLIISIYTNYDWVRSKYIPAKNSTKRPLDNTINCVQGALRTKCTQIVHNDWCTVPVDRPSACCSGPAGSTNRGRGSLDKIYNNTVAIGLLTLQKIKKMLFCSLYKIVCKWFNIFFDPHSQSKNIFETCKYSKTLVTAKNVSLRGSVVDPDPRCTTERTRLVPDRRHWLFDFT